MQILKINQKKFKETVKTTVKALKEGKIIICPTDTVYGLICDAANKKAVQKIFKIKKRPKTKPIPIFVKDLNQAKKIARIDKKQENFLKRVWPGKVTVVLRRKKIKIYGVAKNNIALRIPRYFLIDELARKINRPLAETSVNVSNQPPITRINKIIGHFKGKRLQPDLIIDIGDLPEKKPSVVLDLTTFPPKVLRS